MHRATDLAAPRCGGIMRLENATMRILTFLRNASVALVPAFALTPSAGFAAHAGAPYANVDHSNDMGNDTGDSRVEGLNSGQLNENYQGPLELRAPSASTAQSAPTAPAYAPR
jgi:hypothetical protein